MLCLRKLYFYLLTLFIKKSKLGKMVIVQTFELKFYFVFEPPFYSLRNKAFVKVGFNKRMHVQHKAFFILLFGKIPDVVFNFVNKQYTGFNLTRAVARGALFGGGNLCFGPYALARKLH